MGRNRKPRCDLCGSNAPLDWGETRCVNCKRTCPSCNRLVPYSGRGQPRLLCPKCAEMRPDKRVCPCGRLVPKGRRLFCSDNCRIEGERIRNGGRPRLGWAPDLHTIAKREGDHEKAAKTLFAWLHYTAKDDSTRNSFELRGDSIFSVYGERMYVARATGMGFDINGHGLPEWIPVDDEERLTAMDPPPKIYVLLNGRMDTSFAVSSRYRERWKSESLFVPRYNGLAEVLHCRRDSGKLMFLGRTAT